MWLILNSVDTESYFTGLVETLSKNGFFEEQLIGIP